MYGSLHIFTSRAHYAANLRSLAARYRTDRNQKLLQHVRPKEIPHHGVMTDWNATAVLLQENLGVTGLVAVRVFYLRLFGCQMRFREASG